MQLAGRPIRDDDVRELERLLREGGFVDVASKLDHALTMETRVLALPVVVFEGYSRPLVTVRDYLELVERSTYRGDRVRP